jgi:hypothetical protein
MALGNCVIATADGEMPRLPAMLLVSDVSSRAPSMSDVAADRLPGSVTVSVIEVD